MAVVGGAHEEVIAGPVAEGAVLFVNGGVGFRKNLDRVAPEVQRTGVGRMLMHEIIGVCERMGFRQMIAIIGDGNNHKASVGLHEALGFRQVGHIEGSGYKFGRWLDTLIMQRSLGAGTSSPPSN